MPDFAAVLYINTYSYIEAMEWLKSWMDDAQLRSH